MNTNQYDLLQSLSWTVEGLGWFVDALAAVEGDLDVALADDAISRLCARRGFDDRRAREIIGTVDWLLGEGRDQVWDLVGELRMVIEPPHSPGIRYGAKSGIYPFAPMDTNKCASVAGFMRHRRRGQIPCASCASAMRHYNRLRRASATPIGPQEPRLITLAS